MNALLLAAYTVPYFFLAMWEDAAFGTLWCYLLTILAFSRLLRFVSRRGLTKLLLLGNSFSFFTSLLCIHFFQAEKWSWYFKPFSPVQLLMVLSVLALLLQLLFLQINKKQNT